MYEASIEIIYGKIENQIENGIYKAIQRVGINVDRDELIRALKYDRDQYNKGYKDAMTERKTGVWLREQIALPLSDGSKECFRCSSCLTHWDTKSNYCPYCGANMREETTK